MGELKAVTFIFVIYMKKKLICVNYGKIKRINNLVGHIIITVTIARVNYLGNSILFFICSTSPRSLSLMYEPTLHVLLSIYVVHSNINEINCVSFHVENKLVTVDNSYS